jgi:methionyl aminopeptidase
LTIDSSDELEGLRRAGAVAAEALREVAAAVRPGITTRELDDIGRDVFRRSGARSAPIVFRNFPGTLCISVNDEAVHGVPGLRPVFPGDLVKIDATPLLDGFVADAAITVVVGTNHPLADCAARALHAGIDAARTGKTTRDIGRAIEGVVKRSGYKVLPEVGGHGVGHTMHEAPHVPNWDDPRARDVLHEGLVLAIEPIIAADDAWLVEDADGWTLRTYGGSLAAHAEHTVVVTDGEPIVLTAA